MAMDLGGAKGGVKADINVTPLVDVCLVLLIIFMVVTPMLGRGKRREVSRSTSGGRRRLDLRIGRRRSNCDRRLNGRKRIFTSSLFQEDVALD